MSPTEEHELIIRVHRLGNDLQHRVTAEASESIRMMFEEAQGYCTKAEERLRNHDYEAAYKICKQAESCRGIAENFAQPAKEIAEELDKLLG